MPGKLAFRVDASAQIGTGHVMRCLTLAGALRDTGWNSTFLTAAGPTGLASLITASGFGVIELPVSSGRERWCARSLEDPPHAHWLGSSWEDDADRSREILADIGAELLIIDHYALDARWECRVEIPLQRIVVLDDLADRHHQCGLLIDANLGRHQSDYGDLVPPDAVVAAGPEYALLRAEFSRLRPTSLERRKTPNLHSILVSMGGVDASNATGRTLQALRGAELPHDCEIAVIMGSHAMWLAEVREEAKTMPWRTVISTGVDNMAEFMVNSDLAIGGAGVTAWERCCLGLPSLIVVLAENQRPGAIALDEARAAKVIGGIEDIVPGLCDALHAVSARGDLAAMARAASDITDGMGARRVADLLEAIV